MSPRASRIAGGALLSEVADGVHRLEHACVNLYVVADDDGRLLIVDTGLPAAWEPLGHALRALGHRPSDVAAVVLTHAHFDHIGTASRIRSRLAVPVWLHPADAAVAAHPYCYSHESARAMYPLRYPASLRILAAMVSAGALRVRGVPDTQPLGPETELPVPGRPRVILTPGHTYGHCALHLPDRGVVLSGDALVTLDPYTGSRGAQIIAGAATADSAQALASLDRLAACDTGTTVLLPGHGDPWSGSLTAAVEQARARGAH
ncbi:MBL fold metallo-hydrolase [Cellulomonas sp. PhB143]|uniref:MBL fold metallo-hydrolase n=1 Tax=Cellulomonas sp. PhB143 TaxID=2485186 RepID=UPI000F48011C|nr:MBL fold metallo-hydrolase [Cellulomonas sp. PhB143]ROS73313.1 glyoxylase-like metal-dependent hydrolase (beta-lactamase superfamily II) [Cellulomonas sp. PhB143]